MSKNKTKLHFFKWVLISKKVFCFQIWNLELKSVYIQKLRSRLITVFKQQKLLFKYYNTYFHIFFYPPIFLQNFNKRF